MIDSNHGRLPILQRFGLLALPPGFQSELQRFAGLDGIGGRRRATATASHAQQRCQQRSTRERAKGAFHGSYVSSFFAG
jgi:hypothetical protein